MAVAYRIEGLTKTYRGAAAAANDALTLDIQEGEIIGLLGPNGAGKSTLVNQLAGLLRPTSGSLHLFGIDVVARPEAIAHYVALQPQSPSALVDLYPEEALRYTAQLRGLTAREATRQAAALVEELGLGAFGKRIGLLSGGQRRLVSVALAFVGDRPVQIFDEPTNDLDPAVRRLVWDKLRALTKRGTTVVLVTHNVAEADWVVQRVGIIDSGRLRALGTPGALKARVERRIRLDLLLRVDAGTSGETGSQEEARRRGAVLEAIGEARALTPRHWTVLCPRESIREATDRVFAEIGIDSLEDFRVLTPSLEDAYLQLVGRTSDEKPGQRGG